MYSDYYQPSSSSAFNSSTTNTNTREPEHISRSRSGSKQQFDEQQQQQQQQQQQNISLEHRLLQAEAAAQQRLIHTLKIDLSKSNDENVQLKKELSTTRQHFKESNEYIRELESDLNRAKGELKVLMMAASQERAAAAAAANANARRAEDHHLIDSRGGSPQNSNFNNTRRTGPNTNTAANGKEEDDEAIAQMLHEAQQELRRKDEMLSHMRNQLQERDNEVRLLHTSLEHVEKEMNECKRVQEHIRSNSRDREPSPQETMRRELLLPTTKLPIVGTTPPREPTQHRQHHTHHNGTTPSNASATAGTPTHFLSAIQSLTSPDRRIEEEVAMMEEHLQLKQMQVVKLEGELGEYMTEKSRVSQALTECQKDCGRLQEQVRALQMREVELMAQFAVQQDALDDRAGVVDLLKREFVDLSSLLQQKAEESHAMARELQVTKELTAEVEDMRLELERERRMAKAARDVLKLREQEITTLNESLHDVREKMTAMTHQHQQEQHCHSNRSGALMDADHSPPRLSPRGGTSRSLVSAPSPVQQHYHSRNISPPKPAAAPNPPPPHYTHGHNHSHSTSSGIGDVLEAFNQSSLLKEENRRLKRELDAARMGTIGSEGYF